jgi:hypothetical protein
MEPEIARRCKACGAAVRGGAGYCPQCGAALNPSGSDPAATIGATAEAEAQQPEMANASPANEPAAVVSEAAAAAPVTTNTTSEENAPPPALAIDEHQADGEAMAATMESSLAADGAVVANAAATTAAPTRRHRVKVAAMDAVEGKIAPRVEKLRQASTVMLDEAADDPGLRFVLIAAVLIVLSLVLVLLSQILK